MRVTAGINFILFPYHLKWFMPKRLVCRLFVMSCWFSLLGIPVWAQSHIVEHIRALEQEIDAVGARAQASTNEPEILTKLAGLYLKLGDLDRESQDAQIAIFEKGAHLAKQALTIKEDLADAHFYYAANLGRATQLKGVVASALIVKELKTHAERAVVFAREPCPGLAYARKDAG